MRMSHLTDYTEKGIAQIRIIFPRTGKICTDHVFMTLALQTQLLAPAAPAGGKRESIGCVGRDRDVR